MFQKPTFGANSSGFGGFGQQQTASGTAHAKYNPVVGTDVVVKSGTSQNINIKHHCITCMKEYENKSLEELRLEDYAAGRKGSTGGVFGGFSQPAENKPLFGGSNDAWNDSKVLELEITEPKEKSDPECAICFDSAVDSVLYKCGHSCMCYSCAVQLWREADGKCPICRSAIADVIRIYKA